jgi:TatD DNase family protein
MFDSHCHLDAEEYDADREAVIARATDAGVRNIMVPGYEPREWERLAPLCARHAHVVCAVGLHPLYVHELSEPEQDAALDGLEARLRAYRALAVGECGLDAPVARRGGASIARQSTVMARQVALARALDLPVILHCVRAHGRMLELLEHFGPLPRGGVMHAYGGPPDLIARYARLNLRFSFGGIVTHENAKRPRSALAAVPGHLLMVETDGPSQVPNGVDRGRSEPADVALVLREAARLRGGDATQLARQTTENARALFGVGEPGL